MPAGGHFATVDQQQEISAQQPGVLSPLYVAQYDADASPKHAAQSNVQTYQRQVSDTDLCGSKADAGSSLAPQPDTSAAQAPSPRKYPDTQLYQFADIELAHGH